MEISNDLQELIKTKALTMADVSYKRMFGSDAYLVEGKMFAALGPMGLMLKPQPEQAEQLLKLPGCSRMEMRPGTPFGGWIALDLSQSWEESAVLSVLEESYHYVRSSLAPKKRSRKQTDGITMIEGLAGVIIWTEDLERMLHFYRDVLGLTPHSIHPDFVPFDVGGVRLSIGLHSGVHGQAVDPHRIMVNLATSDIHKLAEELKAKGVEFIRLPEKEEWGGYVATFRDPDGNLLQLLQQP